MKQTTLNSFLIAMKTELKEAEGKRPKFCDELCDGEEAWDKVAGHYKQVNDTCDTYEANLLLYVSSRSSRISRSRLTASH